GLRVVSFSLWGSDPRYNIGAIRNAESAPIFYPGWICRFYCGASVPPQVLRRLRGFDHVDVVNMPEAGDWRGLFWRFLPAADPDVYAMLSRDADSRLSQREADAVGEWLSSDRDFHVMRDHPLHATLIPGGMWGVRSGLLRNMKAFLSRWKQRDFWQSDQLFLSKVIAPLAARNWLEHDEFFAKKPFPSARQGREFVGQPYDEHDRPLAELQPGAAEAAHGGASRLWRETLETTLFTAKTDPG